MLRLTEHELRFRDEVRAFVKENLPDDLVAKVRGHLHVDKSDELRWENALAARGWLTGSWPKDSYGLGWSVIQSHIFDVETALAGAPRINPIGVPMVGPTLMLHGSEWQKSYFLPRIRDNVDRWCQGYSEPGAGSDLAALQCRAVRDGDDYLVSGEKIWTTGAHEADWIFCLVRTETSARKHDGISVLLIPMTAAGITVKPIPTVDGEHHVNQVIFDDVRVPATHRVGAEGNGWRIAISLLQFERTSLVRFGEAARELALLKEIARRERRNGRPLAECPEFAARVAAVEIDLMALEATLTRILLSHDVPGPESSIAKLKAAEVHQRLTELMMDAAGPYCLPYVPQATQFGGRASGIGPSYAAPLAPRYLYERKLSITGGSLEIQRNIIAKQILGL